jgi:AcrR family transcriptional regulator
MGNEMSTSTATRMQPGRPRDHRIDAAVLRAVVDLLPRTGYQGLTVAAVAARAGTTKPAVYRRWPTKTQLVHEAVFPVAARPLVPDGVDLVADVRDMVAASAELFGRPEVRAAVPGLLAEFARDSDTHAELQRRVAVPAWADLRARIERAVASGQARPDIEPDVLLDVIGGATLMALTIRPGRTLDERWVGAVVELLIRGVLP